MEYTSLTPPSEGRVEKLLSKTQDDLIAGSQKITSYKQLHLLDQQCAQQYTNMNTIEETLRKISAAALSAPRQPVRQLDTIAASIKQLQEEQATLHKQLVKEASTNEYKNDLLERHQKRLDDLVERDKNALTIIGNIIHAIKKKD